MNQVAPNPESAAASSKFVSLADIRDADVTRIQQSVPRNRQLAGLLLRYMDSVPSRVTTCCCRGPSARTGARSCRNACFSKLDRLARKFCCGV